MITYPAGPITPHGAYYKSTGRYPTVHLRSYDESTEFWLMGGESIPNPDAPEVVQIAKGGIKNLIAPWRIIGQKGATEDGETFIDALGDPAEIDLTVIARARDPRRLRALVRDLFGSIDRKRTSRLTVIDATGVSWWADVRWNKTPAEPYNWGESRTHTVTLRLRIDSGFWQSDPDISGWGFQYQSSTDDFNYVTDDIAQDANAPWDVQYFGGEGGKVATKDGNLYWRTDIHNPLFDSGRSALMRYTGGTSFDDNMVVEMQLADTVNGVNILEQPYNAMWARLDNEAVNWETDGVRCKIDINSVTVSSFYAGNEIVLGTKSLIVLPQHGDVWRMICGTDDDPDVIRITRNNLDILTVTDSAYGSSHRGEYFRSGGLELHAGPTVLVAAIPAPVASFTVSSNNTTVQGNQIQCVNIGDQPMYRDYTFVGPGTAKIAVKPGSEDYIEFGPLLDGQVVYIRTDPRKPTIVDLTSTPPSPQQLNDYQQAVKDFTDFASGGNTSPLLQEIQSWFGIQPPQGNLYSLLKGRFARDSAIPPAPTTGVPQPYFVDASIVGGNAASKLISMGTPLRSYPL